MSETLYEAAMREKGLADAADLQSRAQAGTADGTAIFEEAAKVPLFAEARKVKNMLERPIGFVCQTSQGRMVKLNQQYNSDIYQQEPEALPAPWGWYWSKDPKKALPFIQLKKALPFIQLATSTYAVGECCTAAGYVWASNIPNNNWSPETNPEFWDKLGTIEEIMGGN